MRFTSTLAAVVAAAAVLVPSALATRFTDDSYFVPKGTVGAPYSHWFRGDAGCGPALPYQFRILGDAMPPPGVSLSKAGHLSGTPTQAGTYSFWVELSDQNPPEASWCIPKQAEREFTVIVEGSGPAAPALPPLAISTGSLPVATAGTPYALGLQATGGGTQSWSLVSGTLPSGLALSSGGLLAGTPATAGTFSFTARVSGNGRSAEKAYTLVVRAPLAAGGAGTHTGEVGLPLETIALSVSGGSGSSSWRLEGSLPAGVTFDQAAGRISGTPTAPGSFPLRAVATDAEGRSAAVELGIVVAPRLAIRTTGLVVGRVGRPYRSFVRTAGGVAPRAFRVVGGRLPTGVRLDPAKGVLGGTPRRAGIVRITIEARDALGVATQRTFRLTVRRAR